MKEKEKLENGIVKLVKYGRWLFSAADNLGTAGKLFVQLGAVILGLGLLCALGATICQKRIDTKKVIYRAMMAQKNKAA